VLIAVLFAILVVLVFFLFYRSETLKRELNVYKARLSNAQNFEKHQAEVVLLLAQHQAELLKQKLSQTRQQSSEDSESVKLMSAILSQYPNIVGDIAFKNESVSKAVERYLEKSAQLSSENLKKIISKQSNDIKYSWQLDTLAGFNRFCELLLEPAG